MLAIEWLPEVVIGYGRGGHYTGQAQHPRNATARDFQRLSTSALGPAKSIRHARLRSLAKTARSRTGV